VEETLMGATLSPDRILRELSDLWVTLGKQGESEGGAGVLRACTMTLIVMAEESDDVSSLGETVAALMPEHPARAILIRLRGQGDRALTDRVYAQCWMPFGQRRQICCEQIEITASDTALADLPPVILSLAVPDLPVIVWCRSSRLVGMPEFRDVAAMARKVVLDSAALPEARPALRRLADAVDRGLILGDLAWTQLTRWRAMLSQVFQNREYLAALPGVSSIRVAFGSGFETSAWYLGAWVVNSLAGAGIQASLDVVGDPAERSLRLTVAGEKLRVDLWRDETRLQIKVNDLTQCTNLPRPTDYLLMREELGIVRHDPVFEQTLATAARLAYPTDK
jgi:glucose-6-phosphate dehydrogenase assembly protein OpcA